jgi:LPXTG-motif cell wall-anchored protein
MNKLRLIAAVFIAGAFTMLSTGAAQAYPPNDVEVIIHIPNSTLIGGKTVHFTATTNTPGLNCAWTIKLSNGAAAGVNDTLTGNGTSFSGSYKTKVVSHIEPHPLTATCAYDDTNVSSAPASHSNAVTSAVFVSGNGNGSTLLAAPQTASASATVTLLPLGGGGDDNGGLPNTGGSNLWIFVLGGALLVGGGAVILVARSRSTH